MKCFTSSSTTDRESTMLKFLAIFCSLLILSEAATEGPDVVNGVNTKLRERPFQVSLQKMGKHFCGGSIINPYYVLTAAHCQAGFNFFTALFVSAAAGMIDVRKPGQRRYMRKFISHENFNLKYFYRNDIALVRLWLPFIFDSTIQPVKLPRPHMPVPTGSAVILSGWGGLGGKNNPSPAILQQAALQVFDQKECKRRLESNKKDHLYDTNICANNVQVRQGQCSGDSGGPLTLGKVQVGVVSWSEKDPYCASTVKPGVYTRVPEYVSWIKSNSRRIIF